MKTTQTYATGLLRVALLTILLTVLSFSSYSQLSIYQYRHVPNDKVEEFIKRETTYWKKVAENSMKDGNLQFWGLFQKMGGIDIQNSSNFLFIVTLNDIDKMEGMWDPSKVFPDVPEDQIETFSMSTVTTQLFVKASDWQQVEGAVPAEHFKYMNMVYHTTTDQAGLIKFENDVWAPFIKGAMDKKLTSQTAWGNAVILSPTGPKAKFNTISFDIYPSLKEVLDTTTDENLEYPDMTSIGELEDGPRGTVIYKIVDAISANDQ